MLRQSSLRGGQGFCNASPRTMDIIEESVTVANDGLTESSMGFINRVVILMSDLAIFLVAARPTQKGAEERSYTCGR